MSIGFVDAIAKLAKVDLFERDPKTHAIRTGLFVGRPFYLDYDKAHLLVADSWKNRAGGLPQGSFLLAYYENEEDVAEALLLRVLAPTPLPTDRDVISSMVEYYKDDLKTTGKESQLDQYTRYEFSFSGLLCRVLGTFYKEKDEKPRFGADLENFYSAHNYSVIKPNGPVLEAIVNFREGTALAGKATDIRIGRIRYSSSRRFQAKEVDVPVYVSPPDFLGKRTAIFEMFEEQVLRYSTIDKPGFKVMKVNFYQDLHAGFELVRSHLENETGDYVASFRSIDFTPPEDPNDYSATTRYGRKKAAYLCCLKQAGFPVAHGFKVKFEGNKELNKLVQKEGNIDPSKGISLEDAANWFTAIWENYETSPLFASYRQDH